MSFKTPLGQVRGLGSAKDGTEHFWKQRVSAVSTLILSIIFIVILVSVNGTDYDAIRATISSPVVAVFFLFFILSGIFHMRLGMQVIIEDYVTGEKTKIMALMANTFFALAMGGFSIFAILKLAFGN